MPVASPSCLLCLHLRWWKLRCEERRRRKESRMCKLRNDEWEEGRHCSFSRVLHLHDSLTQYGWAEDRRWRREEERPGRLLQFRITNQASIDNDHGVNQCPIRGAFWSISIKISVSSSARKLNFECFFPEDIFSQYRLSKGDQVSKIKFINNLERND